MFDSNNKSRGMSVHDSRCFKFNRLKHYLYKRIPKHRVKHCFFDKSLCWKESDKLFDVSINWYGNR